MTLANGRSRGFGYLDLIVVIAIILVVMLFVFPVRHTNRGHSNRVKCASNLRQIGQAMLLYSNENRQAYPQLRSVEGAPASYYTGVGDNNPFDGVNDPAANDVTAALYLLVRTQDIGTEVFTCPSDSTMRYEPAGLTTSSSNFPSRANLSYSIAMPYVSKGLKEAGYLWNSNLSPEFALAADMGPGVDASGILAASPQRDQKKLNSPLHDQEGQNVLFGDGHVEFTNTTFVGVAKDNIYAPAADDGKDLKGSNRPPGTVPQHANDSILLPTTKD